MRKLQDVETTLTTDYALGHDQHVRVYYDQPANDFEEYASSKFEGETLALAKAYESSLNGFAYDEFGSVENYGYHARVLFDDCPWIVCFAEDSQGFVTQISNNEYESRFADYVETQESEED